MDYDCINQSAHDGFLYLWGIEDVEGYSLEGGISCSFEVVIENGGCFNLLLKQVVGGLSCCLLFLFRSKGILSGGFDCKGKSRADFSICVPLFSDLGFSMSKILVYLN